MNEPQAFVSYIQQVERIAPGQQLYPGQTYLLRFQCNRPLSAKDLQDVLRIAYGIEASGIGKEAKE